MHTKEKFLWRRPLGRIVAMVALLLLAIDGYA